MAGIIVGDVVELKSGGPRMTVRRIGPGGPNSADYAACDWFVAEHSGAFKHDKGDFPLTSLKIVEDHNDHVPRIVSVGR